MVDPGKEQLSLFGRRGRKERGSAPVAGVAPIPGAPGQEAAPEAPARRTPPPGPGQGADPVAAPAASPAPQPGPEPVASLEPQGALPTAPGGDGEAVHDAGASPEAAPAVPVQPDAAAIRKGAAVAGPPREQYLFPPGWRRLDWTFAKRMSDMVRRLQLLERASKGDLELTLPQAHAIHALKCAGSMRMQELAESLGLAQSTVTRLVGPLKRMGLLDRRPDRDDGRATRAFLTSQGEALVDDLERADRDLYDQVIQRLPDTRRAEVVAAVALLHEEILALLEERARERGQQGNGG